MRVLIEIEPKGAVRMTQAGKWTSKTAQRYLAYKKLIGLELNKICKTPTKQPVSIKILFVMPIPPSWSKKKRMDAIGSYHTSKPDIDNLIKGLFDAANKILWQDDNQVVRCNTTKIYGEKPCIEFEVTAMYEEVGA